MIAGYTICKVFTESERHYLSDVGERLTAWLAEHPEYEVVGKVIAQSSDQRKHCISAVIFVRERA